MRAEENDNAVLAGADQIESPLGCRGLARMAKTISIFNNKGGVGKTTYMYHVAHMLSRRELTVLMVDCDSQCNLTSYTMADFDVRRAWRDDGNSIFQVIDPVYRTTGDIRSRAPTKVSDQGELYLTPGDLRLSNFEDLLGDTLWSSARGGAEPALRAQSAIHRYIKFAAEKVEADLVLVDLGPNLGALNRAVLATSDYFITPVAPDLFSLQGTENLGNKLMGWRKEWDQVQRPVERRCAFDSQGSSHLPGVCCADAQRPVFFS